MGYLKKQIKLVVLYFLKISLKKKYNLRFGVHVNFNKSTTFEGYNFLSNNASLINSHIGYASYLGENTKISKTRIGKYTSIGPNVICIFGKHPSHTFVCTHPSFFSTRKQVGFSYTKTQLFEEFEEARDENGKYPILIGNDVWIGAGVSILDGVSIGDGAIVASNALVTKDVQPYSIVGGVPAKHIKYRFTEPQISFLQEFKWWDRPQEWVAQNAHLFQDIEKFIAQYK